RAHIVDVADDLVRWELFILLFLGAHIAPEELLQGPDFPVLCGHIGNAKPGEQDPRKEFFWPHSGHSITQEGGARAPRKAEVKELHAIQRRLLRHRTGAGPIADRNAAAER